MPAGAKPPQYKVRLIGSLGRAKTELALNDAMSLQDWKVYGVGPSSRKQGDSTILDYGATPDNRGYQTLGELRAAMTEEASPGKPDQAMNFTGFWKERCEQDFGLQIKPAESAGMYSVSFCGPGGCFEPGTYRPNSFITGDKGYETVTQDEIKVRGGDSWSTYLKCSPDPEATPKQ